MSDIPPELIDGARSDQQDLFDRRFYWRVIVWCGFAMALTFWASCSFAATLDLNEVYCELFEPCQDGRYCIAADPAYTADCPHPWVTLRVAKFKDLQAAYEAADAGGTGAASPFNLSVEDGSVIGFLILSCWASAWVFKVLARTLRDVGDTD